MTGKQMSALMKLTNTKTPSALMDYLQEHHLVSDEAVTFRDVATADAERAIQALNRKSSES